MGWLEAVLGVAGAGLVTAGALVGVSREGSTTGVLLAGWLTLVLEETAGWLGLLGGSCSLPVSAPGLVGCLPVGVTSPVVLFVASLGAGDTSTSGSVLGEGGT